MTRSEAVARLRRLLGRGIGWREGKKPSSPELRAEAQAAAKLLKDGFEDAKRARDERMRELLDDPEYQELVQRAKDLRQALENAQGFATYYRISVGINSLFFTVKARGDNWADVVRQVETQRKAGAA